MLLYEAKTGCKLSSGSDPSLPQSVVTPSKPKSQHPSVQTFFLHPFSVGRGENKTDFGAGRFQGVSEEVNADVKHLAEHGIIFSSK